MRLLGHDGPATKKILKIFWRARESNTYLMDMNNNSDTPYDGDEFCAPFNTLCTFLDEHKIKYSRHPKKKLISVVMVGEFAVKRCTIRLSHNDSLLQIYVNYPIYAKPERIRPSVAEFVTRANYGLALGHFEMDMSDGEIRFHVSQLLHEGSLADEVIGNLFFSSLTATERYYPALMQLLFGGLTAADAVYMAELDLEAQKPENELSVSKPIDPMQGNRSNTGSPKKRGKHPSTNEEPPSQHPSTPSTPELIPDPKDIDGQSTD